MPAAAKFSVAISMAIGLAVFAFARQVVAQDATKAASEALAAKQANVSSDRQRRRDERRQAAAKAEAQAKSETLEEFPKVVTTAPAKPKVECRTQAVTGSRMGKTICATPEQWAETDAAGEAAAKEMRREATTRAGAAKDMGPYRGSNTL